MKKITYLLLVLIFLATKIQAQAPQTISYQTVVRNSSNALLTNTEVGLKISILQGSATGTAVYAETQMATTNANGLVSLQIGNSTAPTGTFAAINWANGPYFIKTETDPAGGSNYSITGTQQIRSVPYALYAKKAENGLALGTKPGQMNYWNGTAWVTVAPGQNNQTLTFYNGAPSWAGLPILTTTAASSINSTTAVLGGSIASENDSAITTRGVCIATTANPTTANPVFSTSGTTGDYTVNATGLNTGTLYHFRAYATNGQGTTYGADLSFTTLSAPALTLGSPATTTSSSFDTINAEVINDGGAAVTERGICWSTTVNPDVSGSHTPYGTGTGSFLASITGLNYNTTYHVRAYAINAIGTAYSSDVVFTTLAVAPIVITVPPTSISKTVNPGGNVTSDGGSAITERGILMNTVWQSIMTLYRGQWGTNSWGTAPGTTGSYTINASGIIAGQVYYYRAYATNGQGTSYGDILSFTAPSAPTLSIGSPATITPSAFININAEVTDGGAAVTERGICWSTTVNPVVSGSHTAYGTGTGSFTGSITGLNSITAYHVRAYAVNSIGTSYSSDVVFTTIAPPTVTLGSPAVTRSNITVNGNVTSAGGATVTARGVCWSTTSTTPDITGSHTTDGAGTGTFTSNINGLNIGTLYHVRAYATNSAGTSYSSVQDINTTAPVLATLTTIQPVIRQDYVFWANTGGNITDDGGVAITSRGIIYSTSPNPTLNDIRREEGTGSGSYTSIMYNGNSSADIYLQPGTTYYVKAYAINSVGVAYGNELTYSYNVGSSFGGGIIAYIYQPGDTGYTWDGEFHGLIAAPTDCSHYGDEIINWFTGKLRVGDYGHGYNDWQIPTINDLHRMYDNRNVIPNFYSSDANWAWYWSSTEDWEMVFLTNTLKGVWQRNFANGSLRAIDNSNNFYNNTHNTAFMRPVRYF